MCIHWMGYVHMHSEWKFGLLLPKNCGEMDQMHQSESQISSDIE